MITAVFLALVVLLVFALAVALGDRVCLGLAERKASEYLGEPFGHPPSVRVHGTLFLTQVLRGRYGEIEVSGAGLQIGEMAGTTLNARLYNAILPPRELLIGRTTALSCERAEGRIVLPYGELARVSRIPGLRLSYERERLVASASVPVPGVSQLARVSGEARLTLFGGAVWLRVRGLSVAGISLPGIVVRQLMPSLNVLIPLPPLPYGLHLDELKPEAPGLLVCASADDIVFAVPG